MQECVNLLAASDRRSETQNTPNTGAVSLLHYVTSQLTYHFQNLGTFSYPQILPRFLFQVFLYSELWGLDVLISQDRPSFQGLSLIHI